MSDAPHPDSPRDHVPGRGDDVRPSPPRERRRRAVGWKTADVLRAAAAAILLYVGLHLLWFASSLVFVVFLGLLFALAVSAGVDRLERLRIPRGIGAALITLGFFGFLYGTGALIAPTITEQSRELRQRLPEAIDNFESWLERRQAGGLGFLLRPFQGGAADTADPDDADDRADPADTGRAGVAEQTPPESADTAAADTEALADTLREAQRAAGEPVSTPITLRDRIGEQIGGATEYLFPFLSSTLAVLSGIALTIFIAVYVSAAPDLYRRGFLHLFPHSKRPRMGEVLDQTGGMLRRWFLTQLIGMAVIGTVTTVALLILDVPAAFALGFLAGLLEFIPTIGPVIAAVPAIAMGFLDSPQTALYVVIVYIGIQFLESNLLMPLLMHEGVDIPPALSIVFQALMAIVFGFLGLLVAVPLLAAAIVPIKMLYVEDAIGDEITLPTDAEEEDDDEPGG
ncbi:MAG TPA: AI-2E family transporter [Gemmatimonadaceae bacterium]|nr:AI-2E family transporter [Gemmatimonadaceae bacterium]